MPKELMTPRTLINIAYYGFFAGLLYMALQYLLPALMPFLLAAVFAALVQKPGEKLAAGIGCGKKPAAILLLVCFYLLLLGVIILCGGQIIAAVGDFIIRLPELYQTEIAPFLNSVVDRLGNTLFGTDPALAGEVEGQMQELVQNVGQTLSSLSVDALRVLSEYAARIPAVVVNMVIMIVSSFYIAADYDRIMDAIRKYVPEKGKKACRDMKRYGLNVLKVYLKSYSLLFLMTFAELTVGFMILKIPYAVVAALAIAVFDILPVLGTGGVLLPWAVIMLVLGDYPLAIGILILYIVITIIRNMIEPRIVGKQIGLHPLITLIAMFVGLQLFGLAGMILLPMTAVVLSGMLKNGERVSP